MMVRRLGMFLPLLLVACGIESEVPDKPEGPAGIQTGVEVESNEPLPSQAFYLGASTLKERIARADTIARVELLSVAQIVEAITNSNRFVERYTVYVAALEYKFSVLEYLKGSGASQVAAIAIDEVVEHATRAEAEAATEDFIARRDTHWDDREAIVFFVGPEDYVRQAHSIQQADRYWFGAMRTTGGEDNYTIASRYDKLWLPASGPPSGDGADVATTRRYLLDVPSATSSQTITLADLKEQIAEIEREVEAGDGSAGYETCVYLKYRWERMAQLRWESVRLQGGWTPETHELMSGLPADTFVHVNYRKYDATDVQFWLAGEDKDLLVPKYPGYVVTARPLPAGEYRYDYRERESAYVPCDAYPETELSLHNHIVTVLAPAGVLHESFFDPVTVGPAVLADGSNGVLEPASFTDANSVSATLESLSYEAPAGSGQTGTVKLKLDPHDGLTGHALDFIGLDGEVSLSLDVLDATVDSANKTLSWSVSTQPWEEGDQLMLRIREAPCSSSTVVADAGNEPGLVGDCEALLGLRDALAGTGTLNWGEDRAITSWDGVTVGGTPKRVTVLNLRNKGLTGVVPVGLGELTGLEELLLGNNQLTGEIPVELGDLVNLRKLQLRYNSLSGEIPAELGSLSALTVLWLHSNRLTGEIPVELGDLSDLEELWLNTNQLSGPVPWELGELSELTSLQLRGNSFAGCLRPSLRDIGDNDLSRLGLTDCTESGRVPAAGGLSVTLAEGTFTLTWNAVTGAARYEAQHRVSGSEEDWTGLTAVSVTSTTYEFSVRSYGDGTTYVSGWSVVSATESVTTDACNLPPVFDPSSYTFMVSEDASVDAAVGTVSASEAVTTDWYTFAPPRGLTSLRP